jgi:hypothetical protein
LSICHSEPVTTIASSAMSVEVSWVMYRVPTSKCGWSQRMYGPSFSSEGSGCESMIKTVGFMYEVYEVEERSQEN